MNSLTNFDTVCNDTLIKEIFPKLTLKALMNLRKTSHRYRQLVSTYLKITTDSITIINVIREGGNIFSKTDKYCYGYHFEDQIKAVGLVHYKVNVERWCIGEQTLVIEASNGGNWFVTKALSSNLWSIDSNFDYKIKDEKIQEYIYQTFFQAEIDEKDDEDDEPDSDITICYFYQGIEIDKCIIYLYVDQEHAIKKIENLMKRCKKIASCIVYC
jgi:hypothetical protein